MLAVTDIFPAADLSPGASRFVVAFTSASMVLLAVVAYWRAHRRQQLATAAAAMLDPSHELRAGGLREGEILLSGVVEHADDHDVAVKISVTQHGSETCSSGSWSYTWTEIDRAIVVKPFYLRLADGTRVRVLAPPNVEVADALDHKVLIARDHRILSAELIPGETLHARGHLERGSVMLKPGGETGYRDGEYEWQLVPGRSRMLLSSEPLGAGIEERARFHRRYARRAIYTLVFFQILFAHFYARTLRSDVEGTVVRKLHETHIDDDGDEVNRYSLAVRVGSALDETQVDGADWRRVEEADKVIVRYGVLGWDLGNTGTLFFLTAGFAMVVSIALCILYPVRRRQTRPWFRRKVQSSGSGQLPGD